MKAGYYNCEGRYYNTQDVVGFVAVVDDVAVVVAVADRKCWSCAAWRHEWG